MNWLADKYERPRPNPQFGVLIPPKYQKEIEENGIETESDEEVGFESVTNKTFIALMFTSEQSPCVVDNVAWLLQCSLFRMKAEEKPCEKCWTILDPAKNSVCCGNCQTPVFWE